LSSIPFSVKASSLSFLNISHSFADCNVPPGSVLSPFLFNLCATPLISFDGHHFHADEPQLYPYQALFSTATAHCKLLNAANLSSQWMPFSLLCLNSHKPEFIIIGVADQIKKISDPAIHLSNNTCGTWRRIGRVEAFRPEGRGSCPWKSWTLVPFTDYTCHR